MYLPCSFLLPQLSDISQAHSHSSDEDLDLHPVHCQEVCLIHCLHRGRFLSYCSVLRMLVLRDSVIGLACCYIQNVLLGLKSDMNI